jgi:hypothetical protein
MPGSLEIVRRVAIPDQHPKAALLDSTHGCDNVIPKWSGVAFDGVYGVIVVGCPGHDCGLESVLGQNKLDCQKFSHWAVVG